MSTQTIAEQIDSQVTTNGSTEASPRAALEATLLLAYGPRELEGSSNRGIALASLEGPPKLSIDSAADSKLLVEQMISDRDKPIQFSDNLYESYKKAVLTGKPLIVQFSQPTCDICKEMDKTTFDSKQVRLLQPYAEWAKIDPIADEDDKGNVKTLMERLGIERIPTTVILDVRNGQMLAVRTIVGYFGPKDFSEQLFTALTEIEDSTNTTEKLV